jgi:tripartite-type tricarboxylate transporter receptor subunit TctC
MTRLIKSGLAALLAAFAFIVPALAQTYPAKPIFLVVGSGPDALARIIAAKLTDALGVQVLVDIQPAAGGAVAVRRVAMSPPDGYTLLFTTGAYSINEALRPSLPVKLMRDFEPVALIGTMSLVLVTSPANPAKTPGELAKEARDNPGKLNCASPGVGTTGHLGCELFRYSAKIEIIHVPYRGAANALVDTLGRRVDFYFSVPTVVPQIKGGELRALAVTGPRRQITQPDVPTMVESGYPDVEFQTWNGVHVAAGTPKPIVDRLHTEIDKIVQTPEMRQRMQDLGFETGGGTSAEFGEFVRKDLERWGNALKLTGVKIEE